MKTLKKHLHILVRITSILCFVFMICHILFAGEIYFWNFPASIPTFFFVIVPLLFLVIEITLFKERKPVIIIIVVFSILIGSTQVDINIFKKSNDIIPQTEKLKELKVFNWNTGCWDQDKDKDSFYSFLKKQNADIYILQEYLYNSALLNKENIEPSKIFKVCNIIPGFTADCLAIDDTKRINKEFPGHYLMTVNQFVIISRFPIKKYKLDYSEQYAYADIDINGRVIRFFNTHMLLHIEPVSPLRSYFYDALNRRYKARKIAFEDLEKDIKETTTDYFVSGDFNSTKAMGIMDTLFEDNIDASRFSDDHMPFTFEFKGLKLWRFDYAFINKYSKSLYIESMKTMSHQGLSDHNPLSVDLYIKDGE